MQTEQTQCCIAGGGPAGAMLALLLACQGVAVVLLEAHMDFDREFRGDTLHPAVLEILDQIGLADRLLQLRHAKLSQVALPTKGGTTFVDLFASLKTKFPYITVIAQSRFLEFITQEAKHYPNFRLILGARVDELIEEEGVICGVRTSGHAGSHEIRAALTVGADGRFSQVRKLAGFQPIKTSPPIDVLWFRLSRKPSDPAETLGARVGNRLFVIFIDRFDYWQVGCVIVKGGYQKVRAAGLEFLRQSLAQIAPAWADRVDELQDWKQISVLSVESSRLKCWHRRGLLLIGDAAHVMSPVGGVGINYAIQDAVVAANLLGQKLKDGVMIQPGDLAAVQQQREFPTRVIQTIQSLMQRAVATWILQSSSESERTLPTLIPYLLKIPGLLALPARLLGYGLWPPHVQTDR